MCMNNIFTKFEDSVYDFSSGYKCPTETDRQTDGRTDNLIPQ